MNYRHLYHVGNFADVFKHIILLALVKSFLAKEPGFCYVDTHAGIGCYDLTDMEAQKTKEYESGIGKISANVKSHINPYISDYLKIIENLNAEKKSSVHVVDKIRFYPGSPLIVRKLIRPQDRMILTELHPDDYQTLKQEFIHDKQVAVHHLDGYLGLKAFLPPKEKRGLVLIDPPFEATNEFEQIIAALQIALERWRNGTYAIWYPIKDRKSVRSFIYLLKQLQEKFKIETILNPELMIFKNIVPDRLNGCGMVIINPPWKFTEDLLTINKELRQIFLPTYQAKSPVTIKLQ